MSETDEKGWYWPEYCEEFPCFSENAVRDRCHPRKMVHPGKRDRSIVLVHGLTDSPYYMKPIAQFFYSSLGYNVYMPLLQCHGLLQPEGMAGVSLGKWKKNVGFAIEAASGSAELVSIGGLSTGGALSYYLACTDPAINGELYLFSAALGLYGGGLDIVSRLVEFLLRLPFFHLLDSGKALVGRHPFRYDRVPLNSAGELAKLILEIDGLLGRKGSASPPGGVFAAWSEADRVININKLKKLAESGRLERFSSFSIDKKEDVEHASVVLDQPVYAIDAEVGDPPLEAANPLFKEMLEAVRRFAAS